MKTITTESWLPVFPGFYNTIFESEGAEAYAMEGIHAEDMLKEYELRNWDYEDYRQRVAKAVCTAVCKELKKDGFISGYKYKGVNSPREYNFRNDFIEVDYKITAENQKKIAEYLKENRKEWDQYLKDQFTNVRGFVSFHSNCPDSKDWQIPGAIENMMRCGSILDFILENEGYTTEDLYYSNEVEQEINFIEYTINKTI